MREMSEYEAQANEFCQRFGFSVKVAFRGDRGPEWEHGNGDHIHGDRYRVTIRRMDGVRGPGQSITFDFWNSYSDSQAGKSPSAYDVLANAKFTKRLQAFFTIEELEALAEIH